jgi:hypothetical protein
MFSVLLPKAFPASSLQVTVLDLVLYINFSSVPKYCSSGFVDKTLKNKTDKCAHCGVCFIVLFIY